MHQQVIGLIGGMSWESSAEYYRIINELTVQRMGIAHGARIVMTSLNPYDFTSRAAQDDPRATQSADRIRRQRRSPDGAHDLAHRAGVLRAGAPHRQLVRIAGRFS